MSDFAPLPDPPYFAVIFANQLRDDSAGYDAMATQIAQLATQQPGYLGVETTRNADGFGITVSYWADEAALVAWKALAEHLLAQKYGKERWYKYYTLRVAQVQRHYDGPEGR